MRALFRVAVLAYAPVVLAACGNDLRGFSVAANNLRVVETRVRDTSSSGHDAGALYASAQAVDWRIPLAGGCGGPYRVDVVRGALPRGIEVVDGAEPRLSGVLLEDGAFSFRVQVTDGSCAPFASTHADLTWDVAKGDVAIVGAEPGVLAPGTDVRDGEVVNPVHPALRRTVYGQFTAHRILVAGGTGPYALEVVDDPSLPEDGSLPVGAAIPPGSTSIVGAPVEVGPGGAPFVMTLRATDRDGRTSAPWTVQWEVVAPAIVIATSALPDGRAGTTYSVPITVADGVPPFAFEFVKDGRISALDYPRADDLGPDYRSHQVPPEGIYLGDAAGSPLAGTITGVPRRRGRFRVVLHVSSAVVPDVPGQQAWRTFELEVAPSEPPGTSAGGFDHDPGYTLEGAFPASGLARIAEAEAGAGYNPDAARHPPAGLQLLAHGGVRKDGRTDAPHASEVSVVDGTSTGQEDGSTPGGGYDWTVDPDPPGDGDTFAALPPGMALDGWTGVWRVDDAARLERQPPQTLAFTALDQQLPLQVRNKATRLVRFAVGPDRLILTESTTSGTTTTGANAWDMNDNEQTVRACLPYSGAPPVLRDLVLGDLSRTHSVPSTAGLAGPTSLATLLTEVDLLRASVNPSGWWDDVHGLNANAARPGQHADRNAVDHYLQGENDVSSSTDWSRQPSATSVDLPSYRPGGDVVAVSHDPSQGVYADGGKMYLFANASHFGAFVVRSDASLYVPFAFSRTTAVDGTVYDGFGDGVLIPHAPTGRSQLRIPHLAVSPDGRFAAIKVKTRETDFLETAATTPLVLFSLTGEKPFGGRTWKVVGSGSDGTTSRGVYLYAPSLVLTNHHAYWLCGNLNGTLSTQTPSRSHYVYRFRLADPATGEATAAGGAGALLAKADPLETAWTNTAGAPLQTRFQLYASPLASGFAHGSFMHLDGGNLLENSLAPLPFRVSADGRSIAILAMPDQATSSALSQAWHVWVDFDGSGVRRLSTAPRHVTGGATRGYSLARGSNLGTYENWHRWGGPTPQMEISDDGTKVAVVANRFAGTPTYSSPTTTWPSAREDVVAYRTSDRVHWTEVAVTGDGGGAHVFSAAGGAVWRFGCLAFTKDGAGLVFWGGFSCYHAAGTASTAQYSSLQGGTLYGVDLSEAASIQDVEVTALLETGAGGSSDGVRTYSTAAPYAPLLPSLAYSAVAGVIKPYGGFLSRNREFLYLCNKGGLSDGSADYRLVGVNVRSADPSASVNGHPDFRAFAVSGWPARRGFLSGTYQHYPYYGLYFSDYPAYRKWGMGLQVMAKETGWVFWGSHHQSSGPAVGTTSSLHGGPLYSTYSYDYASYGGEIEGFAADVGGPVERLSAFGSDSAVRRVHFLEPTAAGDAVAYIYDTYSTANASPSHESLHVVRDVAFDGSGDLGGAPSRVGLESGPERISDAVAFGSFRDRLYYGAGDPSNENTQVLREARFTPTGATFRTLCTVPKRYNVLHAGR